MRVRFAFLVSASFALGTLLSQIPPAPAKAVAPDHNWSEVIFAKLPPDVREKARAHLSFTDREWPSWERQKTDEDIVAYALTSLCSVPEAAEFVLDKLQTESSAKVRRSVVSRFPWSTHAKTHPDAYEVLKRIATKDRDPQVCLEALEQLRAARMGELSEILNERMRDAVRRGDQEAIEVIGPEQERWIYLRRGTMVPGFLRKPVTLPPVKPADQPIRLLAFGDFGTASEGQKSVAAASVEYHQKNPFDFGVTLGDNFYPVGLPSPDDPRWKSEFEDLYGPLGIKFYASLGNHDWGHVDSPCSEILYTQESESWRMPAPYYTYTAGPVQFFALDTNEVSQLQLEWLREALAKSESRWKLCYGHHHIYSATRNENHDLIERLLPVIKDKVDIYLGGHDHNLQHTRPESGVHFFVCGGGGAGLYEVDPKYERSIFQSKTFGFGVLEANTQRLTVRFIDTDGKQLYEYSLEK